MASIFDEFFGPIGQYAWKSLADILIFTTQLFWRIKAQKVINQSLLAWLVIFKVRSDNSATLDPAPSV